MLDPLLNVPRQAPSSGEFYVFTDSDVDEPYVIARAIVLEGGAVNGLHIEFEE